MTRTREKWTGLSDLSHYLIASDTLEDLAESASKYIVDIVGVDYCRIILLDRDGQFYCKAAYSRLVPFISHYSTLEPLEAEKVYARLLDFENMNKLFLAHKDLTAEENASLGISAGEKSWIIPLRVESEGIGVLILGQHPSLHKELLDEDSYYLVDLISDQLSNAIRRTQLNDRLENLSIETVIALSKTLETRDSHSASHSKRMASLSEQMASLYKFSVRETRELCWAALLHDIGKIGVEDKILRKETSLDEQEWNIMRTHPEIGAQIVRGLSGLENIAPLIFCHHERLDGKGYPRGLQGEEIPLGARIIAVVDSYSAMTEGRPYRPSRSHREALIELRKHSGTMYDPDVVEKFISIFEGGINPE